MLRFCWGVPALFPRCWQRLPVCLLALAWGCAQASLASGAVTERQVRQAVDRAVVYLTQQLATGNISEAHISVMALGVLKSGMAANDARLKPTIERIAARFDDEGRFKAGEHHIYDAGVTLMALANADPVKYKQQITAIADYIISFQGPEGDWDYRARSAGDTSISQYAVLGLWEAARSGVKIPSRVWDRAAAWHTSRQLQDGSFTYHPAGRAAPGSSGGTHTMTVAGTASLHVARMYLYPNSTDMADIEPGAGKKRSSRKFGVLLPALIDADEPDVDAALSVEPSNENYRPAVRLATIQASIGSGKRWLNDRFVVNPPTSWQLYYLYGIERLAALAGMREIGDHDWYAEGAELLVSTQHAAGYWQDGCGPPAATSLGVMFLVKATEKMLNRAPDPRFGGGLLVGGRGLPDNLLAAQVSQGQIKTRKLKGPVDELLKELENPQSRNVESAQEALVDTIATENPEALIGQQDRLLKLVGDRRVEVRRTAYWALGRTNDLRMAPTLIAGLRDPDPACVVEARNALRFISKRLADNEPPDESTPAQREKAVTHWKNWYLGVRPYDERDDLSERGRAN